MPDQPAAMPAPTVPPVPQGIDPDRWSRVCAADAITRHLGGTPIPPSPVRFTLDHHTRVTVKQLLLPACGGIERRTEQVIDRAASTGKPFTTVLPDLVQEWSIAERLFHAKIIVPGTGDELNVSERPDGSFELQAVEGGDDPGAGTGYATIVLPPQLMAQLWNKYSNHESPVTQGKRP